jgi:hypothetical protein
VLMGSDAPPEYFDKPQGFNVNLQFDDVTEAERIFSALSENGTVDRESLLSSFHIPVGNGSNDFIAPDFFLCLCVLRIIFRYFF